MVEKEEIRALNEWLKGQYMGLHAYDHFIEKLKDESVKREFQRIHQELEQQAGEIADRIRQLGGEPVTSEGILGAVQSYIASWRIAPRSDEIIKKALEGEQLGIEMTEKTVCGDLSASSLALARRILDEDRRHVETLQRLLIQPVGG